MYFNDAYDFPTKQDYKWSDYQYTLQGDVIERPFDKVKVQNQGSLPACVWFANTHIINGNNILEDNIIWQDRTQIDAKQLWNEYCINRGYANGGTSIQDMAKFTTKKWLIQGYITITGTGDLLVANMKKALDMGHFILTGSSNGDRTQTKNTGIYTLRTDGKYVGHWWDIVWYGDGFFWGMNSYGNRWPHKWYFKVPFSMVDKLFSKLAIIDKDDSWYFLKLKEKSQAMESVRQLKKIYALSFLPEQQKKECSDIANTLRLVYWFTDNDL